MFQGWNTTHEGSKLNCGHRYTSRCPHQHRTQRELLIMPILFYPLYLLEPLHHPSMDVHYDLMILDKETLKE